MKLTYLILATLLMAAPCARAHDSNVQVQEATQKSEPITKTTRAKHFGAGIAKLTATGAQILSMGLLGLLCCRMFDNASAKLQIDLKVPFLIIKEKTPGQTERLEQAATCFLGGIAGASLLYATCKTGSGAWQSFKQAFARSKKSETFKK